MPLEQRDISRMLETAVVAARLAGQRAMEDIRYTKSSIKNGDEIVTVADATCQKIIMDRIKETYPDHGFICEEGPDGKFLTQPPRSSEQIWWTIDPIDGTNNYAHGMLDFCVMVGAIFEGVPVVGVIFEPATESMYTAATGTDAQLNTSRINVSEDAIDKFNSVSIDSHFPDSQQAAILEIIKKTRFRNLGTTGMHLAYVAKGAMVGAVITRIKLWELASASIIIENAGGVVTDQKGGKIFPVDPGQYTGQSYSIVAANKKAHPQLLEILMA
jgi:myo-inositol-1(or 4)-monophosphatase